MMVWLWGINLWFFAQANVGYGKIFDLDQSHLTHIEIWKVRYLLFRNALEDIWANLFSFYLVTPAFISMLSNLWIYLHYLSSN